MASKTAIYRARNCPLSFRNNSMWTEADSKALLEYGRGLARKGSERAKSVAALEAWYRRQQLKDDNPLQDDLEWDLRNGPDQWWR